jgi:hypothetical protein
MLKRLAALLLLVGLCLPYGCDVRPITGVWHDLASILFLGIPVITTVIYCLHTLLPPLAAFDDRNAAVLHAVFRVVYFGLVGGYLAFAVKHRLSGGTAARRRRACRGMGFHGGVGTRRARGNPDPRGGADHRAQRLILSASDPRRNGTPRGDRE